ncbi:serine hydrolase domain-containing protein [Solicola gregarius]|uniref:Beta-lactamase family protein n=1 Tax=Solicola gregarius TaxID=2908642 RepID=A0AA46TEE3_9ACTN|nr:serine hydrolase domain-containing protein [Solicola gregarius]UYM03605.1 beta-lactamase family protein [Solicola gregarius]
MRRAHSALVTAATALAVMSAPAAAGAGESGDDGMQRRLDALVDNGAIGVLAEVRDEHGVWRGTSGAAELGTTRKVPARGRFRAGSETKTFVATVVLQLVGEGRLRLNDTIEEWLPGAVPDGDRITMRQLLNHTSGLYDYQDTLPMPPTPEFFANRWRTWTPDELVERAVAEPPTSEPGSAYAYSNTGYVLLGQVIENVTGRSYAEEIERRIIRPLRLHQTSLPGVSPLIRGPHPHGYLPTRLQGRTYLVDYTEMNPSVFDAGGEIVSSAKDMNRFFAALLGGRLLPDRLLDEMTTPGIAGETYGLGLAWRDTSCGIRAYGNDGDALAYQSWTFATQDRRREVTIALTPGINRDLDDVVDAAVDEAICG